MFRNCITCSFIMELRIFLPNKSLTISAGVWPSGSRIWVTNEQQTVCPEKENGISEMGFSNSGGKEKEA